MSKIENPPPVHTGEENAAAIERTRKLARGWFVVLMTTEWGIAAPLLEHGRLALSSYITPFEARLKGHRPDDRFALIEEGAKVACKH